MRSSNLSALLFLVALFYAPIVSADGDSETSKFFESYCIDCHGKTTQEATLDLTSMPGDFTNADHFRRWVKIHDRIAAGEMPPKKEKRPTQEESNGQIS